VDKSYYTYDFEYGYARVLLTAAVEYGNVILLGATASAARWSEAEGGFKRAAASFKVGASPPPPPITSSGEPSGAGGASGAEAGAGASGAAGGGGGGDDEVDVTRKPNNPAEECKGLLCGFL
jgi:hypothetical protein